MRKLQLKMMNGLLLLSLCLACAKPKPLPVVKTLDLPRYMGLWYEVARMPIFAQKGDETCYTDAYELLPDGRIAVQGTYQKKGALKKLEGISWIPDAQEPGKWKVRFIWPFSAHYWILDHDPNYQWTLIGHPNRKWLWIMARSPDLDSTSYERIVQRAHDLGFDTSQLIRSKNCPPRSVNP
jgi:apolipoprotein D and lipocalin family protein